MRFKSYTNRQLILARQKCFKNIFQAKRNGSSVRKLNLLKSRFYGLESEMKKRCIIKSLTPWEVI